MLVVSDQSVDACDAGVCLCHGAVVLWSSTYQSLLLYLLPASDSLFLLHQYHGRDFGCSMHAMRQYAMFSHPLLLVPSGDHLEEGASDESGNGGSRGLMRKAMAGVH